MVTPASPFSSTEESRARGTSNSLGAHMLPASRLRIAEARDFARRSTRVGRDVPDPGRTMSRGTRQSRDVARARVNEIQRELTEIYRLFPDLRAVRPIAIPRNVAGIQGDVGRSHAQALSRRWVRRR